MLTTSLPPADGTIPLFSNRAEACLYIPVSRVVTRGRQWVLWSQNGASVSSQESLAFKRSQMAPLQRVQSNRVSWFSLEDKNRFRVLFVFCADVRKLWFPNIPATNAGSNTVEHLYSWSWYHFSNGLTTTVDLTEGKRVIWHYNELLCILWYVILIIQQWFIYVVCCMHQL